MTSPPKPTLIDDKSKQFMKGSASAGGGAKETSTEISIEGSDVLVQRYERTVRGEDLHKVLFATGSDKLTNIERGWLGLFLESVVMSRL